MLILTRILVLIAFLDIRLTDYANATLRNVDAARVSKSALAPAVDESSLVPDNWWDDPDEDSPPAAVDPPKLSIVSSTTTILIDYPNDVWHLLAAYVAPEALWKFASLCKAASAVLHTPGFWRRFYTRWFKPTKKTDNSFSSSSIENRLYGLRPLVVRSLFIGYSPFFDRLRNADSTERLTRLLNRGCVASWHRRPPPDTPSKECEFFLKFAAVSGVNLRESILLGDHMTAPAARNWLKDDRSVILHNVWANNDAGCAVLKVTASEFALVPAGVLGCRLVEVSFGLSPQDIRAHRLKLVFNDGAEFVPVRKGTARPLAAGGSQVIVVAIDRVARLSIFDWWHPDYPRD